MNKSGPIVIVEDDNDDQLILEDVFKHLECKNEILFFPDGERALEYLTRSNIEPFLILSDINLPKIPGFDLRKKIKNDDKLHLKCVPYIFITTAASHKGIIEAYSDSVQGFFVKPSSLTQLENTIRKIIDYWKGCIFSEC